MCSPRPPTPSAGCRALSWFVDTFASLADWKGTIDRLTSFSE
ncbi:MAG: hypothetical protein U1E33_06180 [Rhodospirillales bacterium]